MISRMLVNKTTIKSKNGMVTAMHPLAAKVGASILKAGGNAADAAVATAFAIGVVEPFMSGLGGGASIVIHDSKKNLTKVIDGSVKVPGKATEDMFDLLDTDSQGSGVYGWRGTKNDEAETGYRSIAIPGAVDSYLLLHDKFGSIPLTQVMKPAIELASRGFPIDWYVFFTCASSLPRLSRFPETMAVFYKSDGYPFQAGNFDDTRSPDRLIQKDLAKTLTAISDGGSKAFYEGYVAKSMAKHIQSNGGLISEDDLAHYKARCFDPLQVEYRSKLINFAPYNSGGTTVAEILNILGSFDLTSLGHNTIDSLHLIAEAMRMGFSDRFAHMGDPFYSNIPINGLESKAYALERSRIINKTKGPVSDPVGNPWPFQIKVSSSASILPGGYDASRQNTTHLNVIDSKHNMVSLTTSLGQAFGSGVVIPNTGVTLNNGMMWFDPEPGHINSIRPGRHAMHAGTPTLIFDEQGPLMALGAPGGRKVLTSVLQCILNTIDYKMNMQDAISSPRIHAESGPLSIDNRIPPHVVAGLQKIGHNVVLREETPITSYYGRPAGILIDRKSELMRSGLQPYNLSTAVGI